MEVIIVSDSMTAVSWVNGAGFGSIKHVNTIYEAKLEAKKAAAQDQGFEIDELNKYSEVVGKESHGRVLSMDSGIKAKDVYGCCEGSCKRARVDKLKNWS
ncbi:hypothetical protein Dsin_032294 [Dipteronia sinensis]|uniref:Uncharacterized protein n=1 Tax=Dipteronia sinensis TaxID=43782 RepID=A0AAD9ZNI3_9ROSI|nr:hypothetical protein Dsin_032294 [Dipteronia sinensis]